MSLEPTDLRSLAGPPHPGGLLRDCVLPALEITVSQAAMDLATTRQTLHGILAGRTAITPEMAVRLERFCGVPAAFWLLRQQEYDLSQARKALSRSLTEICNRPLPSTVLAQMGASHDR